MDIKVRVTNEALKDYNKVFHFQNVKDYILFDKAGFDAFRADEDLPDLTEFQVERVAKRVTRKYLGEMSEDFCVDSDDDNSYDIEGKEGSFQHFYNFVVNEVMNVDIVDTTEVA